MHISRIASIINASVIHHYQDVDIQTYMYDSRKATGASDELFIALPGAHHDGHDYIPALLEKGTKNFLVSRDVTLRNADINLVHVPNVLSALQKLATYHREQFQLPVVGITGSNGKTIVKEWVSTLLSHQFQVIKSPKSYNSQLGVPLSVLGLQDFHEVGVFEAGISKESEMGSLKEIIQPTIGLFTNIGEAHSEGFSSLEAKLHEKTALFKNCDMVICRYNHELVRKALVRGSFKLVTWDIDKPEAVLNFQSVEGKFVLKYHDTTYSFKTAWTNPLDLENLFHGISLALILGESEANIQQGIDELKPVPMRLELKRGQNNTYILDDSYNNDILGLQVALDYLKQQPHKQEKTVILSDILQSGKSTDELYSEVNTLLTNHRIDRLIGIGNEIQTAKKQFNIPFEAFENVSSFLKEAPKFVDETILVKGARSFGLEKIVAYLEEKSHGTVLEVNFEALTHNLNSYRKKLKPNTKLMVMVKAFAYGVGVDEIAHLLQYHQVDYLGVAYLDEAINLRRKGIKIPIMIMNVGWDSFSLLSAFDLEPEIYSLAMLEHLIATTESIPPIHLKIETGMNRLGFDQSEIGTLITLLSQNLHIKIGGIFTHFSSSDSKEEDAFTKNQAALFDQAYDKIASAIGYRPLKHAVNSAGIARWPQFHYDMVRLGIGLYGFDSSQEVSGLRPISQLKTKISQIKAVKAGESIGYSRKGLAEKDSLIATIALGYADGYTRLFGNGNAYVMINGKKARTIGNVCMDMTMIDVTGLDAKVGDEVIVFGVDPSIEDLAYWSQTIPYEILTNVSQRVKRVFVSE